MSNQPSLIPRHYDFIFMAASVGDNSLQCISLFYFTPKRRPKRTYPQHLNGWGRAPGIIYNQLYRPSRILRCNHFPSHKFLVLVWFPWLIVRDVRWYGVHCTTSPIDWVYLYSSAALVSGYSGGQVSKMRRKRSASPTTIQKRKTPLNTLRCQLDRPVTFQGVKSILPSGPRNKSHNFIAPLFFSKHADNFSSKPNLSFNPRADW